MTATPSRPLPANLRRLRAQRGLTVVQLAKKAGVGRATLTQLESGSGNPTLETLYALANVLEVPLGDLIADPPSSAEPRLLRRGEGRFASGQAVDAWLLHRERTPSSTVEIYALSIRTGHAQYSMPHAPGTREHLHIHSGHARVGPLDHPLDLGPGDYADYPADITHQYQAVGEAIAVATLSIISPAPANSLDE